MLSKILILVFLSSLGLGYSLPSPSTTVEPEVVIQTIPPLGGWYPVGITSPAVSQLLQIISDKTKYSSTIKPICIKNFLSLSKQVINGFAYKYTVQGCPRQIPSSMCTTDECGFQKYEIHVIHRPFEEIPEPQRTQLVSIELVQ